MYDYGARWYDPAVARWNAIDGKAEKYLSFSPYHYAGNNPILNYDIDGNEFTATAQKYVDRLLAHIKNRQANNNERMEKLMLAD